MQICMEKKICKKDFLFCKRSFQEKCTVATKGEPAADDQTFEKFYNTLLLDLIILIWKITLKVGKYNLTTSHCEDS